MVETRSSGPDDQTSAVSRNTDKAADKKSGAGKQPVEIGGPPGPEPTRYGDWAFKGRVSDF